jgi:hypothetical protein
MDAYHDKLEALGLRPAAIGVVLGKDEKTIHAFIIQTEAYLHWVTNTKVF